MQPARPHPAAQSPRRSSLALPSIQPARLQGEKGRQESPKQKADTACGRNLPWLDAAKDLPSWLASAGLPGVGLLDPVQGGVYFAIQASPQGSVSLPGRQCLYK